MANIQKKRKEQKFPTLNNVNQLKLILQHLIL